jgi:hypothetical protein
VDHSKEENQMAQFLSMPRAALNALVTANQIIPGNIYYVNTDNPGSVYIAATDGALVPLENIILSGNITGTPGPQGPQGPAGADGQTAEQIQATAIAMAIALG